MSRIRPFTPDDIPPVAKMIAQTFTFAEKMNEATIAGALDEILFHNPWIDEGLPSFVYEDSDGVVRGFLGVSPRTMKFKGETVKVAITHNFVVESGVRTPMAGVKLFKTMLDGAQDLVISGSAGDPSKYITEKTGGIIGYPYSYGWKLPVRPIQSGMNYFGEKWKMPGFSKAMKPAAWAGEYMLGRILGAPFRYSPPEGTFREIACDELVAYQKKFSAGYSLQPDYTPRSLQWVLDVAGKAGHLGELKTLGLYDAQDQIQGWVIFYLNCGGKCEVLQMWARVGKEEQVLSHMIYRAWKEGATELIGRVEPAFMRALSRTYALIVPGRMWMILHGKNPEILSAICSGDAFISRLEDDLWLL